MLSSIIFPIYFFYTLLIIKIKRKIIYILFFIAPITIFIKIPFANKSISLSELFILIFCIFIYFIKFNIYGFNKFTFKKIFFYLLFFIPIIFSFRSYFNFVNELTFSLKILCSIIMINEISLLIKKNSNFLYQYKRYVIFFLFTNLLAFILILFFESNLDWKLFLQYFKLIPDVTLSQQIKWSNLNSFSGFFVLHHELAYCLYFIFLSILYQILKTNFFKFSNSTFQNISFILAVLIIILLTLSKTIILALLILFVLIFIFRFKNKHIIFLSPLILILFYFLSTTDFEGLKVLRYFLLFDFENFVNTWTVSERLRYDFNSINLILKNPLVGSGDFGYYLKGDLRANSHNFWLAITQKYGLLYFLIFIVIFCRLFIDSILNINLNFIFLISILFLTFGMSLMSSLRSMLPLFVFLSLVNLSKIKT